MVKNRCTVVVTSCDSYKDVWDPFFKLMDIYWKDIPYPVVLNTETEKFNECYNNFTVNSINIKDNREKSRITWSQRMLDLLERVDSKYILILVEDFFLRESVQTNLLERLLDKMDENERISQIQLFGTRTNCDNEVNNVISDEISLEKIGDDKAKVCFVPVIWRKDTLVKWLRPHESIWAFESCGAKRAKRWKYKEEVYRVYSPSIFNYLWEKGCYCIVNGRWMMHPLLTELMSNNNIEIDYNKRGTITMEEWQSVTLLTITKRSGFFGIIKKCINRIRSIF